ncbi:MAG TPA: MoxR family ATPase [Gaiellaceae bacterium]|nr:MoxR family ATPase [Gaiellaceae bacterium]
MSAAARATADAAQPLAVLRVEMREELAKVVVGYEEELDLLLTAVVAGGHVLLEGPPGVAKTLLAAGLARVLGVKFRRIQFTPDTTPTHIVGETVKKLGEPQFVPGAVFTNVLLADEINRTPPRTQAALLEAMQERHVTVDGRIHRLPAPFVVIATQNPFEQIGIFPLPESQLDRFLFKLELGYASAEQEADILRLPHHGLLPDVVGEVRPLLDIGRLDRAQRELDGTPVPDAVVRRCVDIVRATRAADGVVLGASPRAAVHLLTAAKARARLDGREVVTEADVTEMAPVVLTHRLILDGGDPHEVVRLAVASAA